MKNLITHMRQARVKRPKEARVKIDAKLIDSELGKYDEMVVKLNTLENELRAANRLLESEHAITVKVTKKLEEAEATIKELKVKLDAAAVIENGLRMDVKGGSEELARLRAAAAAVKAD